MREQLIVRADATAGMGAGHLMRCLALAQSWKARDGEATFVSFCESAELRQRILSEGFRLVPVERTHPDPEDLVQIMDLLKNICNSKGTPWLVLDGYHFGPDYQRAVREAGHRLLVIDDYNHLLFGPKYALLRSEFISWRNSVRGQYKRDRKILVTLGGADPDNLTLKVVRALLQTGYEDLDANIVVGPANPNIKMLEREIENARQFGRTANFSMRLLRDANMPELMAGANLAVSAGGSTCWELCFLGVPILVIISAENQRASARGLHRTGAAVSLGWHEDVEVGELAEAIEKLISDPRKLESMSSQGMSFVDGQGSERILTLMEWFVTAADIEDIQFRKATREDSYQLWRLANDTKVRRNSFNPEPISYEQHLRWFEKKLESSSSIIYVLDVSGVLLAQVRYDGKDETAEIDYAVIPGFRRKGLGTRILEITSENACRELGVSGVQGIVKKDNKASASSFLKAGFEKTKCKNYLGFDCVFFEKRLY
jgi:spore coat polysaccharide biosynthesis predicted glycosyltransferase SpsG/GNAT superfamily N-acetyltransferase